jgi:hypothetical protein
MLGVRQQFERTPPVDVAATLRREFAAVLPRVKPGARIAIAVGSRGIARLPEIVAHVVAILRGAGAEPFLMPAMGSHGGATPEGQEGILAEYGVTEETCGAPVRPSLEVRQLGSTPEGAPVWCSTEALGADGIVIVNRVKPHTDFAGTFGSGILKMAVIGLGKITGAAACHAASSRLGHAHVIRSMARVLIERAPILCGVAIVENQFHDVARVAVLPRERIESGEEELFAVAKRLMPLLPFAALDLLIVDRIGKNISGAGMDPNVTGRRVQGYSSSLGAVEAGPPVIRRIFVRDLTHETQGNAIGLGLADLTTTRVALAVNKPVTYINSLTSLTPHAAKIPIHFDTDRECIERGLASLAADDTSKARVVRIADTLSVAEMEVSESLAAEVQANPQLVTTRAAEAMKFEADGDLAAMRV